MRRRAVIVAVPLVAMVIVATALATVAAGRATLTVSVRGSGKVTTTPRGISCLRVCRTGFRKGTRVRLRAVAASGWKFGGWSGACSGTGGCSVTLKGPRSVRAAFERDPLAGSKPVQFRASDGVKLEGRLFGDGATAIVLAHGNDPHGQGTWFQFAPVLAKSGYRVLTFNFGGFCPGDIYGCSGGPRDVKDTWLDVAAATQYLQAQGVTKVFLIGASLGGHTVLWAASRPGFDVAGVVSLSSPQLAFGGPQLQYDLTPDVLKQIRAPKLFMAGTSDNAEGYSPAADAQAMYQASDEPKRLELVNSAAHGVGLLTPGTAARDAAIKLVLDFLAAY